MTTTYCTRTDLEAIISPAGLLACIDDDENGGTSPTADGYVTSAIENAASKINQKLSTSKYKPASISSNAWVKWTNAYLAIDILSRRRNNPAVESITSEIKERLELLDAVRAGREQLPEQTPDFDCLPAVSNLKPELYKYQNPIRVSVNESVGSTPDPTRKRHQSNDLSPY
jgi:hypothetical protein